jgi:hypothetical protein
LIVFFYTGEENYRVIVAREVLGELLLLNLNHVFLDDHGTEVELLDVVSENKKYAQDHNFAHVRYDVAFRFFGLLLK